MRTSKFLLSTIRETPAEAETVSHKLMLRAGMIRKLAAGVYNWLPLGLRVLRKVEAIVRQEMNRAGAQEVLMPAVQPAELWQESGRWDEYGPELLRLKDRHQRDFCFGPTHEEIITDLIRREIKSYRQLPANFYQIQMKFRDEIRPRFGVMRAREFLMKDAYSFHANEASLMDTYQVMYGTYSRIFARVGLEFRAVEADTGAIGGRASHEFHVLAESGEDAIALCNTCRYAANVELAPALPPMGKRGDAAKPMQTVDTPNAKAIEEVSRFLKVGPAQTVKTLLVKGTGGAVALVVRGDHELNEVKAAKLPQVMKPLEFLTPGEVTLAAGCDAGSIGPVGLKITVIADESAARLSDFVCGANVNGKHLINVNWGRDLPEPVAADLRKVVEGDPCPDGGSAAVPYAALPPPSATAPGVALGSCSIRRSTFPVPGVVPPPSLASSLESKGNCGGRLTIRRGIEVGHIFQLGTKYSEAMNATCLDETGKSVVMPMGCYGIGVSRIVAAAIEQNHDANGIVWPDAIAPFHVALVPIGYHKSAAVREAVDKLYGDLTAAGLDVLLDDRDERPGVMFADMDLVGIPHRVVLGDKGLAKGVIEYKGRRDKAPRDIPLAEAVAELRARIAT